MRVDRRVAMLAVLVVTAGCNREPVSVPQDSASWLGAWAPGPGATILHTSRSQLDAPTLEVIADTATWHTLWTHTWNAGTAPTLPALDFVLESVVVVGLGRRGGLGYAVALDSIVARTDGSAVYATETRPGANCGGVDSTTAPVHMVRFPGHPPIVAWQLRTVARDCAP